MYKAFAPLLGISLSTFGCLYISNSTQAQVTTDGTVNTQVTENVNVSEITGGETRGSNLFHSFQEFSVGAGNEAFFNNADSISNIFSRVTGGKISDINGLIRANGSASLFLINPAGIIFGEGARLDIGGSFYGSSASGILFEDGEFSAVDLENPPVLTVNAPIGLNLRDNPAPIENNSIADAGSDPAGVSGYFGLRVPDGKTFALAGGDITADGGGIVAFGGRIELAAVGGEGTLGLTSNGDNFSFSFPDNLPRADVSLINTAGFLVAAGGGGDISITAKNIDILEGSGLYAGILSNLGSSNAQAGDIVINANQSVFLDSSNIYNNVNTDAVGNAGVIEINANNLSVTNGGEISSSTFGLGNGGAVFINANESVVLEVGENNNFTSINSNIYSDGKGDSGGVNIIADLLAVNGGAQIQSIVFGGEGNSGKIVIDSNTVSLDGRDADDSPSGAFSLITEGGIGNAGGLEITANSFSMTNRAQILSNTAGMGNAGNVDILVKDKVNLVNSSILAEVTEGTGMGEGGDINITTNSLLLLDGSALLADAENQGDAGNIIINVRDHILMEGKGLSAFANATEVVPNQITSTTDPRNVEIDVGSKGGNISISTGSLSITDDGFIITSTFGKGDAGNLTIFASQGVQMTGGGLVSSDVEEGAIGNGGKLTINTNNLSLDNSQISASTESEGNAGNLTVNATESIELNGEFLDENRNPVGPGGLLAQSDLNATGKGGNLTVETKRLSISNGSKIQTATFNNGDAGEIEIRASEINLFNTPNANNQFPTEISAGSLRDVLGRNENSPLKGNGGSATIETERLSISNAARINVRSDGQGNSGSLNIQTGSLDLSERAEISASTSFGGGGNINLKIDDTLTMGNNSLISAQAFNNADGGNVNIDTNFIVAFPNQIDGNSSDIIASAAEGDGGRININAESLLGIQEREAIDNNQTNDIDASSDFGLDGTVSIFTPDINPVQGATELPNNVVEPEQTSAQACQANREGTAVKSGLSIKDKGGVPPAPDLPLNSQNISINGEIDPTISAIPEPIETSIGKIQPARGIKVSKDGRITLTAYRTNNAGERIPEIKPNCNSGLSMSN